MVEQAARHLIIDPFEPAELGRPQRGGRDRFVELVYPLLAIGFRLETAEEVKGDPIGPRFCALRSCPFT